MHGVSMTDTILMPARMDLVALRTLSAELTTVRVEKNVRIDASEVTHMGALAAQLLLATAREVRSNGGTMEFTALNDRAADQLTAMGLSPDMLLEGTI